jgi:hypothetical protein
MFKIGQTTHHDPQRRIDTLNAELVQVGEIGRFQLEHSAPVEDAYGAEQAVFALLAECRVHPSKEFFLGDVCMLKDAIECVALGGDGPAFRNRWAEALAAAEEHVRRRSGPPWEHPPELTGSATGWIVVLRNDWHADDIYRIGHTQRDPLEVVRRLNRQRRASATVGFFRPVLTVPVPNAPAMVRSVLAELREHRIDGRSRTVQGIPLADWERVIRACAARAIPREHQGPPPGRAQAHRSRRAQTVPIPRIVGEPLDADSLAEPEETPRYFTCPYDRCQATLGARGSPNTTGSLVCHRCRRGVDFEIDESGRAVPSRKVLDWDRE